MAANTGGCNNDKMAAHNSCNSDKMAVDAVNSQFANIKKYYSTVYSHLLSDFAGHGIISLAADSYGKISLFRLRHFQCFLL